MMQNMYVMVHSTGGCEGVRVPAGRAAARRRLGRELPVLPGQGAATVPCGRACKAQRLSRSNVPYASPQVEANFPFSATYAALDACERRC